MSAEPTAEGKTDGLVSNVVEEEKSITAAKTETDTVTRQPHEKEKRPREESPLSASDAPLETAKRVELDTTTRPSVDAPKAGFGSAKGFSGFGGSSTFASSSAFTSLLSSKNTSSNGFSALLDTAPKSSIFDQEPPEDGSKATEDDDDEEEEAEAKDDDQYVVVKGLEKTIVPTGEEGEICIHLVRAKLFAIDPRNTEAGWKERGVGTLRVLQDASKRTRLVMRADAVLRVILNMPLHHKFKLENGGESMGEKTIRLFGVEDGAGIWLAIRVGSKKAADELKDVVLEGMNRTVTSTDIPSHSPLSTTDVTASVSEMKPKEEVGQDLLADKKEENNA